MGSIEDLLNEIFEGRWPDFYAEFEGWVRGSRRFKAFATEHKGKIRAKLKHARDASGMQDLRAELATAALLLREERFALAYELYTAAKQRGPDFTVTFKTHTRFNVEVRRMRSAELDDGDADARVNRLMAVLCDKAGQMPPTFVNLLWLVSEGAVSEADVTRAASTLRQLAEGKAEDFFARRGFKSAADFLKQYRLLSGVVLHQRGEQGVWLNPLARYPVPAEIVRGIERG